MLKVLLVSPDWPYPEHKNGVAKIVANLLVPNNNFEADLLYIGDPHSVEGLNFSVRRIPRAPQYSAVKKIYKFALSKLPLCAWAVNDSIDQLIEELRNIHHQYDVIHLLGPGFAILSDYSKEDFFKKIVFSPIDSIGLHFERRKEIKAPGFKKALFSIEALKCKAFEIRYYSRFKKVSFVSDVDSAWVSARVNNGTYLSIPNGVDVHYFSPQKNGDAHERLSAIFTGNMDYAPNADAAEFLVDQIWPLVRHEIDVDLYIVGANPSQNLLYKANDHIHITGFVDDMRQHLNKASFYVSPLREGSGIKNKILEAMAMGKIVIGSGISFEGISCQHRVHCIYSSLGASEFAKAILYAIKNETALNEVAQNARRLVLDKYSWEIVRQCYYDFYLSNL